MSRDGKSLAPDIGLRSTQQTRVQVGGQNGANVSEQVVDITRNDPPDEVTPFWTSDEQFLIYAGNRDQIAGRTRYQLYRISATPPARPTDQPFAGVRVTNDDSDFLFPTINADGSLIAFIRSADTEPVFVAGTSNFNFNKRFNLYVARAPQGVANPGFINLTPAGGLVSLTETPRNGGFTFQDVRRPSWNGRDLIFSGRLAGQPNYHLFTANVDTGRIQQLTDGPATVSEFNPAVSPDLRYVAFDSNASGYSAGGVLRDPEANVLGSPATAAGPSATGDRNLFLITTDTAAPPPGFAAPPQMTNAPGSHVEPAWSRPGSNRIGVGGAVVYLAFASTRKDVRGNAADPAEITSYTAGTTFDLYYFAALDPRPAPDGGAVMVETAPGAGANPARKLDTLDGPADANYLYNDEYPAFSPFATVFRVAHQSDRTGTQRNDAPAAGPAQPLIGNFRLTPGRRDILITSLLDLTAPTLLRYDLSRADGEIVHINLATNPASPYNPNTAASVRTPDQGLSPNREIFLTVRMEDREAGTRAVYLLFKNPNSKYQQNQGLEHKEWSGRTAFFSENNVLLGLTLDGRTDYGFEFEAEGISAPDVLATGAQNYFRHSQTNVRPGNPRNGTGLYTPSIEDAAAFSGVNNPPLTGIWLQLQRLPDAQQDNQGGVLYGAMWRTPATPSDWYVDVIAYDNAVNPINPAARYNWIQYDNVWGFSTKPFDGVARGNLLFVADHTLGQKFFRTRLLLGAGNVPTNNLLPVFYGAESYFTDVDVTNFNGTTGRNPVLGPPDTGGAARAIGYPDPTPGQPQVGPYIITPNPGATASGGINRGVPNVLGVNSYTDEYNEDRVRVDGRPYPFTGRYDVWRVLCRGPVPDAVLDQYAPQVIDTPPDIRFTGPGADNPNQPRKALVAERMVIWSSPFAGQVFVGPGAITEQATRDRLTRFVQNGGRLFFTSQEAAQIFASGAFTGGAAFLQNVLKAQFINGDGGSPTLVSVAGPAPDNDTTIAVEPWTRFRHAYGRLTGTAPIVWSYDPPSTFDQNVLADTNQGGASRFDSSLISAFGAGRLDEVSPINGAYTQFNYAKGVPGIIVNNVANADGVRNGRVIYASFGFESLNYLWYTQTVGTPTYFLTLARRAEIMHNIICSSRTGRIRGRVIIERTGQPVAGALIRAIAGGENTRAVGTAVTNTDGVYELQGLKPDFYTIYAFRLGFSIQNTNGNVTHGGGGVASEANISVTELPPATLAGIVYNGDKTARVAGVEVQVRAPNPDGTINVLRGVSSATGEYTITGIPAQVGVPIYTVVANPDNFERNDDFSYRLDASGNRIPIPNTDPRFNARYNPNVATTFVQTPPQAEVELGAGVIVVNNRVEFPPDKVTNINFLLTSPPQPVSGRVFDAGNPEAATNGIVGATVTATRTKADGTVETLGTTTTGANGAYRFESLPSGSVTITAQANSYLPGSITVAIVGSPITDANIGLKKAPPGSIAGLVKNVVTDQPVAGITVQLFAAGAPANATPLRQLQTISGVAPGADGKDINYRFENVETGNYVVRIVSPGATTRIQPAELAVTVVSAQEVRADFSLLPPGSISGLVTSFGTGQVVTGATVQLYQNGTLITTVQTTARQTAADGYVFNYRFDNVPVGIYNVRVNKDGLPTTPDEAVITVNPGQETKNVNFQVRPLFIYADGIQMISTPRNYQAQDTPSVFNLTAGGDNDGNGVPGEPNDQSVFSTFNVADWTGQEYNISPTIRLLVGKGYFVRFGATATVTAQGSPTGGPGSTFDLILPYVGWHIIGNPFDPASVGDVDLATSITVVEATDNNGDGRTSYTLREAVQAGVGGTMNGTPVALVRDVVYYYTGSNSGSQYIQDNRLRPWLGYWFRTFRPVTLQLTAPATPAAAGRSARTVTYEEKNQARTRSLASKGTNDWRLQVAARQGDLRDTDNSVGVAPGASDGFDFTHDNEKPPRIDQAPSVYLAFQGKNETGRAAGFTDDIRAADGAPKTYQFTVTPAENKGDVTVFWPNINRVPRGVVPTLVDVASGKRIPMRSSSGYRFVPNGRAVARQFVIEVRPRQTQPLEFMSVRTVNSGSRAVGAQRIVFRTTQAADVEVEVLSVRGTKVRSLRTRAVSGQEASVLWDGKDEKGGSLPAGPYVLSLTAHDDEGNVVMRRLPMFRIQ